jgi:hypothetical protein
MMDREARAVETFSTRTRSRGATTDTRYNASRIRKLLEFSTSHPTYVSSLQPQVYRETYPVYHVIHDSLKPGNADDRFFTQQNQIFR